MPTFGSLFAGIGGIDLGLEWAGWECRFQVEWDAKCQERLADHWPDVPRYGDITAVDWSGVKRVDLLAGGFPCQPFSYAGQRRGKSDDRWLWPAFADAIRHLRPRYVLVENVPGLLAGHGGMGAVLGDLASLGYDAIWDCIPASAVGAPHLRYRVWIVAHANDLGGFGIGGIFDGFGPPRRDDADGRRGSVALADAAWDGERRPRERTVDGRAGDGGSVGHDAEPQAVADSHGQGSQGHGRLDRGWDRASEWALGPGGWPINRWWSVEPDVGRVAHGVPSRVDRLKELGNAVVPQVVEVIGRRLLEAETQR